jgi:hypothetical protein
MKSALKLAGSDDPEFPESTCEMLRRQIMVPQEAPLYRRMSIALEDLIQQGVLRPGEQLPSERNMTRQLGLSRRTVRAALGNLIETKQLVPVHGKGNFIRRERRPMVDVMIPEPFLPDHWGNRPNHYQWIRDAAQKTYCAEKYLFAPDLEALDRVLQAKPGRQEGILIFRPSKEWLDHLCGLARNTKLSRRQPIVVINRETEGSFLNSATDHHEEAVAGSVLRLARQTPEAIGLITAPISHFTFAAHQKQGFLRALSSLNRPDNSAHHLEISHLTPPNDQTAETIAAFIRERRLGGVIVGGSAFELLFLSAFQKLDSHAQTRLKIVLFTEQPDWEGRPPGATLYIEPTEKVLSEGLMALHKILEGEVEPPIHCRVLGDFVEIPHR